MPDDAGPAEDARLADVARALDAAAGSVADLVRTLRELRLAPANLKEIRRTARRRATRRTRRCIDGR